MNVLLICTEKLPVPNIRGGAIQTYIGGVAGFIAGRHRLTILGRSDPDLPDEETVQGIRYVRIPSNGDFELYTRGVVDYLAKCEETYDIIQIFNRPRLVLPVREQAPSATLFLSVHNDMFHPTKLDMDEGNAAIEQTHRIITISRYIGGQICKFYPQAESKIIPIYSGVDLSLFAPWQESRTSREDREAMRALYGLESKKVILFVGRLSRNKGPHVLIRAMSHLAHPDAVLVVAGGSWYSENKVSDYVAYLQALAARSPLPVIMTGYVPAQEIHRWFCAADVFVCTSIWDEPLARVHFEAMAAGLPFITTDRGGNPEAVIDGNGLLVLDPEDSLEYADKLNAILSNEKKSQKMGITGRRLAEKYFTWERVAREILAAWES